MTVTRRYACNLCRDTLEDAPLHPGSLSRTGVGIHFEPGGIRFKLLNDAENHLCTQCVEGVWAERQFQKTEVRK